MEDDHTPIYHSYEDPGYLAGDPIELQPFDSDCILGSPLNSPSVIHARWGEPVDDPDEENVCTDFVPNPFKLGFCVNCMKQHDVMDDGGVAEKKEYKKIARPTISKTAANALDNPSAIPIPRSSITMMMEMGRESDIDLAQLLAQRRDVLMKLDQLDLDRKRLQQQQTELTRQKSAGPLGSRTNRRTAYEVRPNKFDAGANARTEKELLALLKSRGVPSICESISREINYAWAVLSGFKTLANVGNFYFACGSQAFRYNPGLDFFAANGMQLAVFALHKFVHNEQVLVPVLDCLNIYSKLHVDGALEFLAVEDAKEILMKCVRFHDNKHDVIAAALRALGSLVMNDLVKESISTPDLVLELLGLLKRYDHSLQICRAVLIPLGFFVTDALIAASFIDNNGIALAMTAMKQYVKDTELVWHAIGTLNGLHAKTLDIRLILAIFNFTGVPRLVEAVASHLDTEEVTVEGFQLLARVAALPDAYRAINECKVLDLAYVALFAYSGAAHRHTRLAIKNTLHSFQKCALFDPHELARRDRASRTDIALYALLLFCFMLNCAFALYDQHSSDVVLALLFEFGFAASGTAEGGGGEVIASAEVTPLHLNQYPGLFVISPRFLTELGMLVGVVWFMHKQLDKLLQYRLFYFLIPNHVADFLIVVLWASIAVLRLQAVLEAAFPMLLTLAEASDSGYVDLGANVHYLRTERSLTAACAVLMWWRLLRLAKTVKPLESTVDKLERAQALLQGYALLLLNYVLGFAHVGMLLFPSARSSFRSYTAGIATMARTLARQWHPLDMTGQVDMQLFHLLFQFSTTFVVLNIVVAILRERFDSSRVRAKTAAIDGLAMLELAKQQLEAHAARGIKKFQLATRDILAVSDEDEKLSDLKKAWGLDQPHLQLEFVPEGEAADVDKGMTELSSDDSSRLLAFAEEYEQKLDHQISIFSSRLSDMLSRLGTFQLYLGDELGADKVVHEIVDVEQIQQVSQTEMPAELPDINQKDEMRVVDLPSIDSIHEGSVQVQGSAGLPGAIINTEENE
ncbi:hypothetical protein JM18_007958 [Phytophthora kernoviae]|uniref:Polycystin cation channel PKD1/PKD2 domain-containing protein n=2 Tax=Phytophthora kernoviae TaxID=325452 RepID=A0A8T0LPQ2_9STRA|nr:hypothetical protein G195_009528 [Phytophthora kernoviae 00238/432]KAG2512438.1 hypothetical protein JM16_008050 [Phytophthora kernoviae]KAG2516583.1 hypothetical protein JM18_007958 [Phytophthora kernoviae]